ncbi:ATP-binding protein, partial [Bacteriovoracales bacterium]|nr:ATP-binding protein [Bacteriovoracales bacterium]
ITKSVIHNIIMSTTTTKGVFSLEYLNKIPEHYHQYLDLKREGFSIKPIITSKIIFSTDNFLTGKMLFGMDIVFLQNVFPALKRSFEIVLFQKMTGSVKEKGILITEGKTILPGEAKENFSEVGEVKNCIFECIKRGDIHKLLGEAQSIKETEKDLKYKEKIRETSKKHLDKIEKMTRGLETTFDQEKESLYLDEISALQKELSLTKSSLNSAIENFQRVFENQVSTSQQLKEKNKDLIKRETQLKDVNTELSSIKDSLFLLVEARTSELKESNIELEKSNQALEKIQNQRSLFFANLSHELRTPLNAILGFSKILQKKIQDRDKTEKDYIESINTSGKSLLRMVNSVHDFSKIELNELKVVKHKCNLRNILTSTSLHFKNESANKGILFELELNDDIPTWIESDELGLKQVFDNVLSNALKFTKKGHIKFKITAHFISEDKFQLGIIVEDSGRGMSSENMKSLFEPFSQVHKHGTVQERGSGLGLYITSKIVSDLGGEIHVLSKLGKGSIFSVIFPEVSYSKEKGEAGDLSYKFFGQTILIADDIPVNIKLYEAYLTQHHLKIETAYDGRELIEKTKKVNPDLIVTDYEMPELNADDALKILRKESIETPVILISALRLKGSTIKGFQSFLQKPVDEDIFLREVAKFLKHEKTIVQEEDQKSISFELTIPENLGPEDLEFKQELHEKFKYWRVSMEVTTMEEEIHVLKKQIIPTGLNSLVPLLEKVEESAKSFNIRMIENLLDQAIEKTKK